MGFDDAFADGEAEAGVVVLDFVGDAGEFAEEDWQAFGGDAAALVGDGDGDVFVAPCCFDLDDGGGWGVPGGVVEEVGEDLHNAPGVGHCRGQVGFEVDGDVVASAAAEEGVSGFVDERGDFSGIRGDGEGAGLDAGDVE